jgi:multiple antibiotic resistance protein
MNPFGTVPVFVSLTEEKTKLERNKIAFWTSLNVLIILVISFFIGKYILLFFGITLNSLKIAGGLIIASSGFALLTGEFSKHKGMKKTRVMEDICTIMCCVKLLCFGLKRYYYFNFSFIFFFSSLSLKM